MDCPTCGWLKEGKATTCPDCGAQIRKLGPAPKCPGCGARVTRGAGTCPTCGRSLHRLFVADRRRVLGVLAAVGWVAAMALALSLLLSPGTGGLSLPRISWMTGKSATSPAMASTAASAPAITSRPTATPTEAKDATPASTQSPLPTATVGVTPTSTPTVPAAPTPVVYTVRAGDVLLTIAQRFGVTVAALAEANGLRDVDSLRIGQELVIPGVSGTPSASPTTGPTTATVPSTRTYVVQRGDTLISIAERFGITVAALVAENGLRDADVLRIGQELRIPGAAPAVPTPAPTLTPTATSAPTHTPTPEVGAQTVTPGPVATSSFMFAAPNLLTPPDGAVVQGGDDVLLNWASVGLLSDDMWYVVRVWPDDPTQPTPPAGWTRTTSWRVPASYRPAAGASSRRVWWSVTVMRAREREEPVAVSPVSQVRWFTWQ